MFKKVKNESNFKRQDYEREFKTHEVKKSSEC